MASGTRQNTLKNGVKVLVAGHTWVGKTTIINRLCEIILQVFSSETETFKFLEATLYDMPSLRKLTIGTADAFIIVYGVDDDESFDFATTLIRDVRKVKGQHAPLIVVANKSDKDIPIQKCIMADCVITIDYECDHFEVCAHNGNKLDVVFKKLLEYYGKYLVFPDNTEEEEEKEKDNQKDEKTLTKKFKTSLRKFFCIR